MSYCGSCHKENGQGVKNIFPSLTNSKVVSGRKNNLLRKVIHGAQVEGQSTEKFDTRMSPFGFLTDEELAAILTYIRKEFGNGAGAISVAEIQKEKSVNQP
ncbi:MAG: cytochrome c [Chitinophagaceae bacterium]|nr:cytochrome c [Chitinophagaceae bacterium]